MSSVACRTWASSFAPRRRRWSRRWCDGSVSGTPTSGCPRVRPGVGRVPPALPRVAGGQAPGAPPAAGVHPRAPGHPVPPGPVPQPVPEPARAADPLRRHQRCAHLIRRPARASIRRPGRPPHPRTGPHRADRSRPDPRDPALPVNRARHVSRVQPAAPVAHRAQVSPRAHDRGQRAPVAPARPAQAVRVQVARVAPGRVGTTRSLGPRAAHRRPDPDPRDRGRGTIPSAAASPGRRDRIRT